MQLTLILGSHQQGKTTQCIKEAIEAVNDKKRVLFVTTENSATDIESKAIVASQYDSNLFNYLDIVFFNLSAPEAINFNAVIDMHTYDVIVIDNADIYYKTLNPNAESIVVGEFINENEIECDLVISVSSPLSNQLTVSQHTF
jgi:predicted ATP-dependent serine protease